MKISIAMATFNGAKYVKEQLDSFAAQTRMPDELVVCDDCSNDETFEILRNFSEYAPFDVYIYRNSQTLGYAQNFNKALSFCTGDLIFLSDQDDVWFKNKIESIEDIARNDPINLVFMNDAEITYGDLRPTGLTKLGQIKTAGLPERAFVMGCCAAIKANLLKDLLPIPPRCGAHDVWIVRIAEGLGRRRIIEKSLQYYRRHGKNESLFPVNSTKKINIGAWNWHLFSSRVNKNGMEKLEVSRLRIESMIERLYEILSDEPKKYIEKDIVNKYIDELFCELKATITRLKVLNTSRIKRSFLIAKMLARGQYKHFYGLKSALGDLILE